MNAEPDPEKVRTVLAQAARIAARYYKLTGRPLGITGEIAEAEAARILGWKLAPVRTPGHDAIRPDGRRVQIKGRLVTGSAGRVGAVDRRPGWDTVALVLLDADYRATAIYEVSRPKVLAKIRASDSKHIQRGAFPVRWFMKEGKPIYVADERTAP
jgi:hypothetical protein